jgi:Calcineurin-like phosphoesterase
MPEPGQKCVASYNNLRRQDASIADTGVRGNHEGGAVYFKRYFPQPYQPGGLYRSLDYGPMHIALLDQYTAYNAGSVQYKWLKNDLASSTKTWKFVVLHEPGWSSGGGHPNNTTVQTDLEPLFKQYGVSIVFGGHNHYYARATVDGIQHLTVGGGGAPLYVPASGYPNIVVASQNYSFGQFTISGTTLTARVVSNSGAVLDTFTIRR